MQHWRLLTVNSAVWVMTVMTDRSSMIAVMIASSIARRTIRMRMRTLTNQVSQFRSFEMEFMSVVGSGNPCYKLWATSFEQN